MILNNASSHVFSSAKVGKSRGFSTLALSNMTLWYSFLSMLQVLCGVMKYEVSWMHK